MLQSVVVYNDSRLDQDSVGRSAEDVYMVPNALQYLIRCSQE